jgi:hypothetical protein
MEISNFFKLPETASVSFFLPSTPDHSKQNAQPNNYNPVDIG